MRKVLFTFLIIASSLTSCKKDKAELLTGEWEATDLELAGNKLDPKDIGGVYYSFSKDGKFEYTEAGQTEEGTYTFNSEGMKLGLNYTDDKMKFEKDVVELTEEKLILLVKNMAWQEK